MKIQLIFKNGIHSEKPAKFITSNYPAAQKLIDKHIPDYEYADVYVDNKLRATVDSEMPQIQDKTLWL